MRLPETHSASGVPISNLPLQLLTENAAAKLSRCARKEVQ
jgi:hypothetical protein